MPTKPKPTAAEPNAAERPLVRAALRIDELRYNLENISADDSKKHAREITPASYSDDDILREARYVLSLFMDPGQGHINGEDYRGEGGPEQRKWARAQVRQLQAFLLRYGVS